jgi:hypothetical protein
MQWRIPERDDSSWHASVRSSVRRVRSALRAGALDGSRAISYWVGNVRVRERPARVVNVPQQPVARAYEVHDLVSALRLSERIDGNFILW